MPKNKKKHNIDVFLSFKDRSSCVASQLILATPDDMSLQSLWWKENNKTKQQCYF